MLKITQVRKANEQRLILCGQLSGPWVNELLSTWERGRVKSNGRTCVVDLSDVTSIDERGERLLRRMNDEGVRFVAQGVDMKHILSGIRNNARPSVRKSLEYLYWDCVVPKSDEEKQ
jgi:ABC-type transporter Mla MlaB component